MLVDKRTPNVSPPAPPVCLALFVPGPRRGSYYCTHDNPPSLHSPPSLYPGRSQFLGVHAMRQYSTPAIRATRPIDGEQPIVFFGLKYLQQLCSVTENGLLQRSTPYSSALHLKQYITKERKRAEILHGHETCTSAM